MAILAVILAVGCLASLCAEVRVTEVSVAQRWPWNGLVDITYSIECDDAGALFFVSFSGYDRDLDRAVGMTAVTGDGVDSAVKPGGPYTATWDSTKDAPEFHSSGFEVTVTAEKPLYMIVNLSQGAKASSYPVRYSMKGPDVSKNTCRTTELWLRRIPAGTFLMGSPSNELGRDESEIQHLVTLTQDYYIGVFECTQRQYKLVMDTNPSYFNNTSYYASRPVEKVSYDNLRGVSDTGGAGWPTSGHVVDADSFFGKLQAKTGLPFDLPTEAQWEYACRADTATALNSAKNLTSIEKCSNMAAVGRYWHNGGSGYSQSSTTANGTAKVGSYLPNAWGLYDMHGNVIEWCLDWLDDYPLTDVINPPGSAAGSWRVVRGGDWYRKKSSECRSAFRTRGKSSACSFQAGFRIVCLNVSELKKFKIAATGAKSNKTKALYGTVVLMKATLPEEALATDYEIAWSSVPDVEISPENEYASFTMPAEDIAVTCVATLKTYQVTTHQATADKSMAARGETITLTASLPAGALVSDYDFKWSSSPTVDFVDDGVTAAFTMPAEDVSVNCVATRKVFAISSSGATANKDKASRGETILVTAIVPDGAKLSDCESIAWSSVPEVEFVTDSEGGASFTMPAEDVSVNCALTLKKYPVSAVGATANRTEASPGEMIILTAVLPEGTLRGDCDFTWNCVPTVELIGNVGIMSFKMPSGPVTATCVASLSTSMIDRRYLVVDLSRGSGSELNYRLSATGPDLSDDACRTTELWLRRIPAGTFIMGSPEDELGRYDVFLGIDEHETLHQVTLTQDYYIGVFECTQRQYELVMGKNPSAFNTAEYYATRPVEQVNYNNLRGASMASLGIGWPTYGHSVSGDSFFGRLRAKTGLTFDLPTEAQWEYACRAGTTTALNSGKNLTATGKCPNMAEVGRYWNNGGGDDYQSSPEYRTAKVGSYLPNGWGLYDMHGNVSEWCLDWHDSYSTDAVIDPAGSSGSYRVLRGGSWRSYARGCRSAHRDGNDPSVVNYSQYGFRVALCSADEIEWVRNPFGVSAVGATSDKSEAKYGETVTLTADLPGSGQPSDYYYTWSSVPEVPLAVNGTTATFMMPHEAIEVTCVATQKTSQTTALYLVVDLSEGPTAKHYPIRGSATGPKLSDDACRTTELWLRRIPAGTFTMGSPSGEIGRESSYESQHTVTLTQDFYIGVFEFTQRQYELVMGVAASNDTCPVEQVSYDDLRGRLSLMGGGWGWPQMGHAVDAASFLGKLRAKTGLEFDLPTEAQWEYACRAGTTTALNSGKDLTDDFECPNMAEVGRYVYNGNGAAKVGSYQPNAWGLYDMHGNVSEWCLDFFGGDDYLGAESNPPGARIGLTRVSRGGSHGSAAWKCRSAFRGNYVPSSRSGFRVVCIP